jgi:WD40 repeat protein
MAAVQKLSVLALGQILGGVGELVGVKAGEGAVQAVVGLLANHLTDHSQKLPIALSKANESAWKALEIALAGESLWSWLDRAENRAFRAQVRAFLDATPLAGLPGHGPEFRQQCLRELRAAQKAGLIPGSLNPQELANQAGHFARFSDPQALLDAENATLNDLAEEFRQAKYPSLAHLVGLRVGTPDGATVLVAAVRYFFRREVETDRELFQGLTWAKLDALRQEQEQGFAALADALAAGAAEMADMLASVQEVVVETHGVVVDIQKEVNKLAERFDVLRRELRPRDSLSINDEGERKLVRQLVARYRALPQEQRHRFPELLGSIGKLEIATGDFDAAQRDFLELAGVATDKAGKAEAHHSAFGAALERGDHATALAELQRAVELDAGRYAPFPWHKYEPEKILGAGGFGVAFLCRNRHSGVRVVIKTLRSDTLDRQVADVFREARVLEELDHSAIIRLRDCDYADAAATRPYLVMDYFEGTTLQEHIDQHGPLAPDRLLPLARAVAEALRAAHARGILHRDIKPANLLVRPDGAGWRVKLIDFGLALKQEVLQTSISPSAARLRTVSGYAIAGTIDYAAPEQMGRLPNVPVGPHTDVYAFGRTCCYALFKTVNPLRKHWRDIPEELADVLEQCLHESPQERLATFDKVLDGLAPAVEVPAPPPPVKVPAPPAPAPAPAPVAKQTQTITVPPPKREWWRERPQQEGAAVAAPAGNVRRFEGHSDAVLAVAFAPDGQRLLSGSADASVRLWDVTTGAEVCILSGHTDKVWSVAFLPDGTRALSAGKDRSVRLWDLERGREIRCFEGRTNRGLAVSPDGKLALTGSVSDGMVRLWQVDSGRELGRFKGHMSWVLGLAFTPDGKQALTSSADGTVRLWEVNGGRELKRLTGHKDQVQCVAAGAGGRQALSGGADQTVRLWDLKSGKQLRQFTDAVDQLWCVAYSPDGWLAAWEGPDWAVVVHEPDSGNEVQRFQGHSARVMCVAFGPDGRSLLSGGVDKTLCLWQMPG